MGAGGGERLRKEFKLYLYVTVRCRDVVQRRAVRG